MIRKDLVAMFGPRFLNDALDPSHPEYGCLLLDPKCNLKGMNNRQTTMRQVNHHPYRRSDFMRRNSRDKLVKRNDKIVSSMSLSRLLNTSTLDTHNQQSNDATFSESPNTTPSPTFRVVPLPLLASKAEQETHLLPPIFTNKSDRRPSEPRITPIYSPSSSSASSAWSSPSSPSALSTSHSSSDLLLPPPPTHTYSKDVIDTINATILLQRLSQDDGARPFKPMHPDSIPSKVVVGNQEYSICWEED